MEIYFKLMDYLTSGLRGAGLYPRGMRGARIACHVPVT